jgi:hypothetical protein
MRPQAITLGTTMMLLISTLAFAQSRTQGHDPDQHNDRLFARLSYSSGHIVDWRQEQGNPQICFALYRSGYYRVSRLTERGTETLQGTLSEDQVLRFRGMLENLDFQSNGGAVTRNGAEVFIAEVVRKRKTVHYVWIDPNHERPFPNSAMSVVKWLQDFKPEGSSPLTVRELSDQPSICPLASKPMLPLLASSSPAVTGSSRCKKP